ncbi:hypothetical protein ACFODO_00790 [Acinetobacter sichuanensis]|uniref:DUF1963 domain-containing protein n=1 Tax=Acinetobacter sichuanensis TaxID=2136183 RepID=A0A371YUA4_9GAMM|nr:hypothetical protein [Acinetobacter sichuanensis]RFC84974.1 hypothetical protein C9E89_003455 [Acinetobacter sichuanensis]
MLEEITTIQPYLTLLPDNEAVFAPKSAFLAKHLLPLISIDLSVVNPKWQGKIHLINPIEPYECYIGSETTEFADEFANENWFILQLNDENQYEWLGNPNYFQLENPDCDEELKQHSQEMHQDYLELKARFKETGKIITRCQLKYPDDDPVILLEQLGGEVSRSNWHTPINEYFNVTHINEKTDEEIEIHDYQGRRYYFVASVPGWRYCIHGADDILIFYQPETKRVLFTFDWT